MISVLVVDDEENSRICLAKLLRRCGFIVAEAANGYQALDVVARKKVDLVITDINMPEMNGLVLLKELNERYPHIKIIMITAYTELRHYLEAMNLGVLECLNKPFRIEELKAVISKMADTPTFRRYPYTDSAAAT